ncbi:hypothetical protein D3C73_799750 [compost metagenome]
MTAVTPASYDRRGRVMEPLWNVHRNVGQPPLDHPRSLSRDPRLQVARRRRHSGRVVRVRRQRRRCHRRGRLVHLPGDVQVVGRLQHRHRQEGQLPVHRFRRWYRPDQGRDRGLRFVRCAAEAGRAGCGWPGPVPVGDRRRGAGDQRRWRRPGRAEAGRSDPGQHLPGQDHHLERPGHRRPEQRPDPAQRQDHHRPPFGRFGHHLQLRQLPVQGQPGVEEQGR